MPVPVNVPSVAKPLSLIVAVTTPVVTASTLVVVQLEASVLPFTPDNTAVYRARAVVHVDPTYPEEACGFYGNF